MFKITSKIESYIVPENRFGAVNIEIDNIPYCVECSWLGTDICVEKIVDLEKEEEREWVEDEWFRTYAENVELGDLFFFIEYVCKRYMQNQLKKELAL